MNVLRIGMKSEKKLLANAIRFLSGSLIVNHYDTLQHVTHFRSMLMLRSSSFFACVLIIEAKRFFSYFYIVNSFNTQHSKKFRENAIWWLKMYLELAKLAAASCGYFDTLSN